MGNEHEEESLEKIVEAGALDLMQRVRSGQVTRAYGRDAEVEKVFESLISKRSALLLGPSDVGKTAILHEVATRLEHKHAPEALHGARIVSVSTGTLMSGTKYLGEWQTQLTKLLEAVKEARKVYLYFEDIWVLRDAGRASDDTQCFVTLIRPYLERQDLVLLGESTQEAYTLSFGGHALADDPSFMRLFSVITVEEPGHDATLGILRAVARDVQRKHKVSFAGPAIDRALELARRFLPYQAFPGKATRVLEEAAKLKAQEPDAATAALPARARIVTTDVVSASFSRLTGLPEKIISDTIPLTQEEILAYFTEHIVGQEEAVRAVADVVTLVKAELNDPGRPLGVLFFVGPTGVGKTELAKTLAEYLFGSKDKLIRFDMSEYQTYPSLPALLQNLTERQRRQSFSVLLLDEIEKAGPFVFDLFLQAFDDARLTSPMGRSVDLHNTIIILTSNIGTGQSENRGMGFVEGSDRAEERRRQVTQAVEDYFRPEFINRLDKIIVFRPLGREEMRLIARRELIRALRREGVQRRNILLDFRIEVLDVLLEHGFSPTYGARPLQRAIKDQVMLPLARRIAAQPATGEQLLELYARDGQIDVELIPVMAAAEPEDAAAQREPRIRVAIADLETGRERRVDLSRLEAEIAALRERIEAHIEGERYQALQARGHALLEETAQPTFWDDPERSRPILAATYRIERVTDGFVNLRDRGERLAEVAVMIRRHGDTPGIARLAASYETLGRDLALAELELLASGNGDEVATDTVFVCVSPVSAPRAQDAGEWPETLRAMYAGWAERKGYEIEAVHDADQPPVLRLSGPNLGAILRGEEGIHKLQREGEGTNGRGRARPRVQLARVEILAAGADEALGERGRIAVADAGTDSGTGLGTSSIAGRDDNEHAARVVEAQDTATGLRVRVHAAAGAEVARALLAARIARHVASARPSDEVVRVYSLAGTHYARDPRTGTRVTRPRDVLAGHIDSFLLAYLKLRAAAGEATEPAPEGLSGE